MRVTGVHAGASYGEKTALSEETRAIQFTNSRFCSSYEAIIMADTYETVMTTVA